MSQAPFYMQVRGRTRRIKINNSAGSDSVTLTTTQRREHASVLTGGYDGECDWCGPSP